MFTHPTQKPKNPKKPKNCTIIFFEISATFATQLSQLTHCQHVTSICGVAVGSSRGTRKGTLARRHLAFGDGRNDVIEAQTIPHSLKIAPYTAHVSCLAHHFWWKKWLSVSPRYLRALLPHTVRWGRSTLFMTNVKSSQREIKLSLIWVNPYCE